MDPTMPAPGATTAAPQTMSPAGAGQQAQMTPEQLQQAIMMMNMLGQGQQGMGQNQMMNQAQQQNASLGGAPQPPGAISPQAYQAMFGGAM
jgi:hypothetical protein